jgi:hypothetical protein
MWAELKRDQEKWNPVSCKSRDKLKREGYAPHAAGTALPFYRK